EAPYETTPPEYPTDAPTEYPTEAPYETTPPEYPTDAPTEYPTEAPYETTPPEYPTDAPTEYPTDAPTEYPTEAPYETTPPEYPTDAPTEYPTEAPTEYPTKAPKAYPTKIISEYSISARSPCKNQGVNGVQVENKGRFSTGVYFTDSNNHNWRSCCNACWEDVNCHGFSYKQSASTCELTTTTANTETNKNGWKAAPMPRGY
ncbi:hypothetical protein BBI17_009529, partial [Phytophthora kernoviae]